MENEGVGRGVELVGVASDTGRPNADKGECRRRACWLPSVHSGSCRCSAPNVVDSVQAPSSSASCSEDAIAAAHSRKCPLCAAQAARRGSDACGVGECTVREFSRSVRIQSLKMHPRVQHVLRTGLSFHRWGGYSNPTLPRNLGFPNAKW